MAVDTTTRGRRTGPFVLDAGAGRVDVVQAPTSRSLAIHRIHWFTVRDDPGQALRLG